MARDRANIYTDIWASGEYRALSIPAQWLYKALLTNPTLSYAGVADWRPGRLAALARLGTVDVLNAAGSELMMKRFVLVDEVTEEVLVRSFIKHDGLLKQPKLTVSMCKAFAAVASSQIREVIAFEMQKLHEREPDLKAWEVSQMQTILWEQSTPIEAFTPAPPEGFTHPFTLAVTPGFTPTLGQGLGLPTSTDTSTATPLQEEGGASAAPSAPSPFCSRHPQGTDKPCRGCKVAWAEYEKWAADDGPVVHEHLWFEDGTCISCTELRGASG